MEVEQPQREKLSGEVVAEVHDDAPAAVSISRMKAVCNIVTAFIAHHRLVDIISSQALEPIAPAWSIFRVTSGIRDGLPRLEIIELLNTLPPRLFSVRCKVCALGTSFAFLKWRGS
ncbi:MAG: hypothetical protein LH466_03275 [Sphingomonas bacterium]|nr:hypothetical protein [Sphingomonas bacterium]